MPKNIDTILGSEVLSEDVRQTINETWEANLKEAREEITAELREEFASRYENDKSQIVEAMDRKLTDVIKSELTEFAEDKRQLEKDRVAYRSAIKEHAKLLDSFITTMLSKEVAELREDRKAQDKNFGKLEEFVLGQLTKELNEFHEDKRALVEQKVKMVREGKKIIAEAKAAFIKNAAKKAEKILESTIKGEFHTLKEDVRIAKENEFGRKIFETFAAEFMTSTLSEGTQVANLSRQISDLNKKLDESAVKIAERNQELMEAKRQARIASDRQSRATIMNEMMEPLGKKQREVMVSLLESVKTDKLRSAFQKYLPNVLNETQTSETSKAKLTESTSATKKAVTGDKKVAVDPKAGSADIVQLKKLAGI